MILRCYFFPIILVSGGRIHQPQPIEIQKIQDGENDSFEGKKKKSYMQDYKTDLMVLTKNDHPST